MLSKGLDLEILIPDLTAFYKARNRPAISRNFPFRFDAREIILGMK